MKSQVGDIYAVPLRPIGFASVVITVAPRNSIRAGYFFGPARRDLSELKTSGFAPSERAMLAKFGDLGVREGRWKKIGEVAVTPEAWPSLDFLFYSEVETVSASDLATVIRRRPMTAKDENLPRNQLYGHEILEDTLSKLLEARELLWEQCKERGERSPLKDT